MSAQDAARARATHAAIERLERGQKDLEMAKPLNPTQKETLDALKTLHLQHMGLEREYREEWTRLKLRYFKLLLPLYESRAKQLKERAPPPSAPGEAAITPGASLGLPDFWLTALKNHSTIFQTIETYDEPILRYLENIEYEWKDETEQMSFRIIMTFAENPFFTNTQLTKDFELENEPETDESVLAKSTGTVIDWKSGKNVMKKACNKKQRNKRTGDTRIVRQVVERESFFHFFDSHEIPDDEKLETMREREVQTLENTLEVEYEMGCIIRDKIITHAVGWYLGVEIDEDDEEDDNSLDEEESRSQDSDEEEESDEGVTEQSDEEDQTASKVTDH